VRFQCFAARKIFVSASDGAEFGAGNSRRAPARRRGGEPSGGSETDGFPKPAVEFARKPDQSIHRVQIALHHHRARYSPRRAP
jgi:hypothetical protein